METSTDDGGDPARYGVDDIQEELSVRVCNADIGNEVRQVVRRNVVTRELTKPTEGHVEHHAVAASAGLEQLADIKEVPPGKETSLLDGPPHFRHLQQNQWMVEVSIRMQLGEYSASLFISALAYEPSR